MTLATFSSHPTAIVESDDIGEDTKIWAYAHVMQGARLGRNCNVGDHAFLESGVSVGDNVTIKNQVCLWKGVTVEDDCFLGPQVCFTNDLLPRSPRMPAAAARYAQEANWLRPTTVKRGCSIGAHATIIAGVELGRYSMVAAGAVVTRDVADFSLVAGNPARPRGFVCVCGQKVSDLDKPCVNCQVVPQQLLSQDNV